MKPKVMIHHREIKCEPCRVIPTTRGARLLANHCAGHICHRRQSLGYCTRVKGTNALRLTA